MRQVPISSPSEEAVLHKVFQAEVALRQWLAEYYSVYQPARGDAIDLIIECVCDLLSLPRPSSTWPVGQPEPRQTAR